MTPEEKDKIISKIKRCLALSKSSNEHEAATALRQASSMMQKYGIDEDDIEASDINSVEAETKFGKNPATYQIMLSNLICKLFGCKAYFVQNRFRNSKFAFLGEEMYATIASYAFDVLHAQLTRARKEYMRTELKGMVYSKNKRARAEVFCQGWISAVKSKVENIMPPKTNLPLIEMIYKDIALGGTLKASKTDINAVVPNDYYAGRDAGKKAVLHSAMYSNATNSGLLEQKK